MEKFSTIFIRECGNIIQKLNFMVGMTNFESKEDLEIALFTQLRSDLKLSLKDTITESDKGPIYHFVTFTNGITINIFVSDFGEFYEVIAIRVGPNGTYLNEDIKNVIKGL